MLWMWFRRVDPRLKDVAVTLVVLLASVGWAAHRGAAGAVVLGLAEGLPLLVRRRWPLAVLAVVLAATVATGFGYDTLIPFGLMVALYTVGSNCERRRGLPAAAAALAVLVAAVVHDAHEGTGGTIFRLLAFAAAWVVGDNVRTRRAYLHELELRAERLEREREENVRRATAEEQARIARELHDVIAHNVSVMVVQAAAGDDVFDTRPERAREALRAIEATGRTALTELRRLLGVVRAPAGDAFAPQPGLALLGALVDQVRAAGLPVELRLDGSLDELPAGVDLSAYRVVQEALTNTLKHADAAAARVSVRRSTSELELEIADDGSGAGNGNGGGGQGLIGMRERVALFGGRLDAGPAPGGGFVVHAVFPLAEAGA